MTYLGFRSSGGASRQGVLFLALLVLVAIPVLRAQSPEAPAAPPDPGAEDIGLRERMSRLVERVKYEQNRIETLQARLVQYESSELLLEPEESQGWFRYRPPEELRWEIVEPDPMVVTVRGDVATTWYADLGTAKVAEVGRLSEHVLVYLGPAGSLETLMKNFTVRVEFPEEAGAPYYLHLTADYRRVEKYARTIDIWIDAETFLPRSFKVVGPSGDELLIELEDMVLNEPIDDEEFILTLPDDVEVTKVDLKKP